jgi:hypothetical protein
MKSALLGARNAATTAAITDPSQTNPNSHGQGIGAISTNTKWSTPARHADFGLALLR